MKTITEVAWCRSRTGRVVHRASCRHAATGVPWHLVDGYPDEVVASVVAHYAPWLRFCTNCVEERLR